MDAARPCPVCGPQRILSTRAIGGHQVGACETCGGVWLDRTLLDQLVEKARRSAGPPPTGPASKRWLAQPGPLYRSCPCCTMVMNRQNFGGSSGVIIDRCMQHGLWLDAGELDAIVAWARSGGTAARPTPQKPRTPGTGGASWSDLDDPVSPIFEGIFQILTDFWW